MRFLMGEVPLYASWETRLYNLSSFYLTLSGPQPNLQLSVRIQCPSISWCGYLGSKGTSKGKVMRRPQQIHPSPVLTGGSRHTVIRQCPASASRLLPSLDTGTPRS